MPDVQWGTVGEWFGGIATTAAVIAGATVLRIQLRLGREQLREITEARTRQLEEQVRQFNLTFLRNVPGPDGVGYESYELAITNHSALPIRSIGVVLPNSEVEINEWSREGFLDLEPGERRIFTLPCRAGDWPQFVTAFVTDNLGNLWSKSEYGEIKSFARVNFHRYAWGAGRVGEVEDEPFFRTDYQSEDWA